MTRVLDFIYAMDTTDIAWTNFRSKALRMFLHVPLAHNYLPPTEDAAR